MSISIGTVLACVNFTNRYKPVKDVCISPWRNNQYCQLTFDNKGAVSLEWYQKNFAPRYSLDELVKMAEKVNGSEGLTAKSQAFQYQTVEQAFEGVGKHHTHGHFIRALMESSAGTLMLTLPSSVKIFIYTQPADMRSGFNRLSMLTESFMLKDPFSGHLSEHASLSWSHYLAKTSP